MSKSKSKNKEWFFSALTLLFIGLKLTNYIIWSWWLVLSPIWIPLAAVLIGFAIFLVIDWAYNGNRRQSIKGTIKHESKFMKALREAEEHSDARDN